MGCWSWGGVAALCVGVRADGAATRARALAPSGFVVGVCAVDGKMPSRVDAIGLAPDAWAEVGTMQIRALPPSDLAPDVPGQKAGLVRAGVGRTRDERTSPTPPLLMVSSCVGRVRGEARSGFSGALGLESLFRRPAIDGIPAVCHKPDGNPTRSRRDANTAGRRGEKLRWRGIVLAGGRFVEASGACGGERGALHHDFYTSVQRVDERVAGGWGIAASRLACAATRHAFWGPKRDGSRTEWAEFAGRDESRRE